MLVCDVWCLLCLANFHCTFSDLETASDIARIIGDFRRYETQALLVKHTSDIFDARGEDLAHLIPRIRLVDQSVLAHSRCYLRL